MQNCLHSTLLAVEDVATDAEECWDQVVGWGVGLVATEEAFILEMTQLFTEAHLVPQDAGALSVVSFLLLFAL